MGFTEPDIKLGTTFIVVVDGAKFLEIVLKLRPTFRAHIRSLKTMCDKAVNVLMVVGHTRMPTKLSVHVFIVRYIVSWFTVALSMALQVC